MKTIGLDIGTKNVVVAYRKPDSSVAFLRELNGYFVYPRPTKFIENMLGNSQIVRSDGTKRAAKWIKMPDGRIIVLGADAEELAYAHNDTMRRPMAEGGVTSDDDSLTVLASIVQGLLEMAENEVGKFGDKLSLCYCTTAPAINKPLNIDYHKNVVDMIISGYETKTKINLNTIPESHAIVLKESPEQTGIGLSWGAGTVTASYVKWGQEIFSFCWVGAGDWVDLEVARRHGYDDTPLGRKSKETPTTVSRRKQEIDLTPGKEPGDRIGLDILLHYQQLIKNVINGIISGFVAHENEARIDGGINVYMAGGTSSPAGFEKRVAQAFKEAECPFEVAAISRSKDPLYAVAEGCLMAAEIG